MMIDSTAAMFAQAQSGLESAQDARLKSYSGTATKNLAQAQKAGEEFEAMFLSQMLGHMFSGIETDPNFGGGHGETMFRSMLVDEYAKEMARGNGIGIADAVTREILKAQEGY
ncbi:MAG: rod-binding protein [Pseudomonadota bacterium]